jgi:FkbM family methyltransferase
MSDAAASFNQLSGLDLRVKVVDIGANPIDSDPPYAGMLKRGAAEVVGFEPNPDALAVLEQRRSPLERYFPHAVGDGRRHTLKICQAPGMTSLLEPDPAILGLFHGFPDWGTVLGREEIDTVRLDDVAETAGADMLKLDIQGAELMVLQNATERLAQASVIQAEVEFLPLYRDQPLFGDVERFLRAQGFVFHRFFPLVSRAVRPMLVDQNIYAGLSQLVWADGLFLRDFTRPAALSDHQLLAMAAILHDCYQSYDIVLHLLAEHDRRHGGGLGATYFTALQAVPRAVPQTG